MAKITMRIRLGDFALHKPNDNAGKDEPYLLTVFAKLDSPLGDFTVPIEQKTVPIHFPDGLGLGALGPNSNAMSLSGRSRVPVPAKIGEWETTLDTKNLDFTLSVMRSCSVGVAVVFLEEDSTLDSSVQAMLPVLKSEVRKRANKFLRFVLGADPDLPANLPGRAQILAALAAYRQQLREGGLDVNGAINGGGLMDHVLAAVLPGELGKAIGKILVLGGELGNIIAAAFQLADADEFIGVDGRQHSFFDLVGLAHGPTPFKLESAHAVTVDLPFPPGFQPPQIIDTSKATIRWKARRAAPTPTSRRCSRRCEGQATRSPCSHAAPTATSSGGCGRPISARPSRRKPAAVSTRAFSAPAPRPRTRPTARPGASPGSASTTRCGST